MDAIRTTRRALRRLLLEHQLLLDSPAGPERSASPAINRDQVLKVIRQLECVQIDPVSAVRANQHLTLAARIAGYEPELLGGLLQGGDVFEYIANAACILPMEDYPIFEPTRRRMRQHTQDQIEALRPVVDHVLRRLESEGPLPAKAFDSELRVHGYWDDANAAAKTKATSLALHLLVDSAQIRIVGREGNQRLFDVTSRSVPAALRQEADGIEQAEAHGAMLLKYFRAYRVFEPSDARFGWQRLSAQERRDAVARHIASGIVAPVEVEGLKQPYYMLTSDVERLAAHTEADAEGRNGEGEETTVRFLPPLDNLLWSRKRLEDLFGFEYRWEIYTPAVKRKYGYYAMPILAGDRLIGRMDPRLDTKRRHLSVELLQIDPGIAYDERLSGAVARALELFARAHGADTVSVEKQAIGS